MSWMFLDGTKFNSDETLNEMTFDGADMWVSAANSLVKIYGFWGDNDGFEEEIDLIAYLTDAYYLVKAYDEMYIFNQAVTEFVRINIANRAIIGGTISIKQTTNCVPTYGNFKMWFVTEEIDKVQRLYYYDITDGSWSIPVDIPGRHQTTKRKIIWGKSDYIYITMVNESSLGKFNADTGAFIQQVITNRMAGDKNELIVNDARDVLISGFNGMVTSVDQITNSPTNISGLNTSAQNFVDDGTYLWTNVPSLARITKGSVVDNYLVMAEVPAVIGENHSNVYARFGVALNQPDITSLSLVKEGTTTLIEGTDYTFDVDPTFNEQRLTIIEDAPNTSSNGPLTLTVNYSYNTQMKDFNIVGFTDTSFKDIKLTPTYTHEYWDEDLLSIESKTEPQRVCLLANKAVYFAYNLADSWAMEETRTYNLTIKGTALVGVGEEAYHGETQ